MSQAWLTLYYHPEIMDKLHRDNCASCQLAKTSMGMFTDLIRGQEIKKIDD